MSSNAQKCRPQENREAMPKLADLITPNWRKLADMAMLGTNDLLVSDIV